MGQAHIIPTLRYKDALSAIAWLCDVLEFKEKVVYASDDIVHHAQLTMGGGMIMVGSMGDSTYDKQMVIPMEINGKNTQSAYIYMTGLGAFYERIKAKNVDIVLPLTTEEHGTNFTIRDPEGHLWNFGDYDPWAEKTS